VRKEKGFLIDLLPIGYLILQIRKLEVLKGNGSRYFFFLLGNLNSGEAREAKDFKKKEKYIVIKYCRGSKYIM